jgi:hypothetical protein
MLTALRSPSRRYGFALLSVVMATLMRLALNPVLGDTRVPFTFYLLAVMVTAWACGLWPALLSVLLGALTATYLFIPPNYSLSISRSEDITSLVVFVGLGSAIGLFIEALHRAQARTEAVALALSESREQFSTTLRSIGDAVIATDAEGIVVFMNPVAQALTGWPMPEAKGQRLADVFRVVNEATPGKVENPVTRVIREDKVVSLASQTLLLARDGREIPIDESGAPIRNEDGAITGVVLVFHDTTERRLSEAALRESEVRLQLTLEAARMGNWDWNARTGELNWSEVLSPIHGLAPGSFPKTFEDYIELIHTEDREHVRQTVARALVEGGQYNIEFRVVWPDGSIHWIGGIGRAFFDEAGEPVRMIGLGLDVTERRRAEEALRTSEERYRAFVENSSEAIWRFELQQPVSIDLPEDELIEECYRHGYLAECNDVMAEMYGFRGAKELVGAGLGDLLVRSDPANLEYLRNFIRSGFRLTEAESHEFDRDGQQKYFLNNLVGIIENRMLLRAWGTQRDITERKRAEEERLQLLEREHQARARAEDAARRTTRLQELTARLAEALTPAQVAAVVLNEGLAALGARAGSVALLSERGDELVLLDSVGFSPELIQQWQRFSLKRRLPLTEAVRTGEPVLLETIEEREKQYQHLVSLHTLTGNHALAAIPLIVEGRALGAMGISFAEARKFNEDDRAFMLAIARQCAQAIARARLYEAERRSRAEAEAANRIKDEFLATLSHELRTPLTAMLGWTRLLRTGNLDEPTSAHALETVERNARAQAQLIEDLLDVSRIISGNLMLEVKPVELVPVINAAVEAMRPAAQAKAIDLRAELDPRVGPVSGDPARLQQVVWNLVANAVKFTPQDGRVDIELARADSHLQLSVRDTGEGIKAEFLPYVFDRFRQADGSTTRVHGGLGLGLAIVRHLVELHGGTVKAESDGAGKGASFTVRLPLLSAPLVQVAGAERELTTTSAATDGGQEARPLHDLRMLVVDDESDARELLAVALEQQGAKVRAVSSVAEAFDLISQFKPDVLVSDIGMPNDDGYELIRRVRSLAPLQGGQIPAVAVTAYAGDDARRMTLDAGFNAHLAKPLDPAELLTVIISLVRK